MTIVRAGAVAAVCTLVLAGTVATPLQAGADTVEVGIAEYRYDPPVLTITVGTTVRWVNHEQRTSHSILFTGDGGFESDRFFPGESWERTFDTPGRYPYSCGPHPEMHGVIEVVKPGSDEQPRTALSAAATRWPGGDLLQRGNAMLPARPGPAPGLSGGR